MIPSRHVKDRSQATNSSNSSLSLRRFNTHPAPQLEQIHLPTVFESDQYLAGPTMNRDLEVINKNAPPASAPTSDDEVHSSVKGHGAAAKEMVPLPADFVPGEFDVLIGRGKVCYGHR